ncbi:glycoside hydrolase family 18 protein [Aspergillus lucknowensis]|uniref:chitinase n=1 Tax=Aspergillus lucknowensis TaxID=176173 RepID=A0ABR4LYS0_9EURO
MNPKPVYLMYLASWRPFVPELALVPQITHVSLAFVSPAFFDTSEPPPPETLDSFFTDIESLPAKFPKGTKILWALGGWGDTESFRVDLDWEYRGGNGENYKKPGCTNADKVWGIDAYPELFAELRAALGPERTLCAAIPCIPRDMIAFDAEHLAKVVPHMDFFSLMAYDLINRRDTLTGRRAGKAVVGFAFYLKWFKVLPIKNHPGPIKTPIGLPTAQMEDPVTGDDLVRTSAVVWSDGPCPSLAASLERAVNDGCSDDYQRVITSWTMRITYSGHGRHQRQIVKKYDMVVQPKRLGGAFAWDLGCDS